MSGLVRATTALAVVAVLAVGCSDDGDTGGSTTTAPAELTRYDDIGELHAALEDADLTCELEYEGLEDEEREVSRCNIGGQQANLTIWFDEGFVAEFLAENPTEDRVAVGINWTVDAATPEIAAEVADALGGVVPAEASAPSGDS